MKTKMNGILTLLLAFVVQLSFAQERSISGTVSDDYGPVADISVIVKGTNKGTVTDFDGKYTIKAKTGDELVFSHVSFETLEKIVGTSNTVNVTMLEGGNTLTEVVITTAFGIQRKPDEIAASTEEVKSEELTRASASNIADALTGKVSGLRITKTSSGVNESSAINLRGVRSFSGSNEALIVIDGVPSTTALFNSLDPESVANVNVMKGASGAALYGAQGANGVIIVTTKKGRTRADSKGFDIAFKSSTDFETVAYLPERQTRYGQGWASGGQFTHFVYENGAWGPEFDGASVPVGLPLADGSYRYMPYETLGSDHIKDFYKTGLTFNNSITLGGGSKESYINFSAGQSNREFIIEDDTRKRNTLNLRAGKQLGKFNVSTNIQYIKTGTERTSAATLGDLLQTATNIDVNQFADSSNDSHWNGYFMSPYWRRDNQRSFSDNNRVNASVTLGYELNDNISFNSTLNTYNSVSDGYNYANAFTESAAVNALSGFTRTVQSSYGSSNGIYKQKYADLVSNFEYKLTDNWEFDGHLGYTMDDVKSTSTGVSGVDLTIPGFYNISNVSGTPTTSDSKSFLRGQALFADATFGYKDYLFLNVTGRNDWLSRLHKDNRSLFYPSAGISFIPTKAFDNFGGDILNRMKVSYSYVKVGNARSVGYASVNNSLSQASGSFYGEFPYGSTNAFLPSSSITDPFLKPEFVIANEVNLTMEFLDSKIRLDASAYTGTAKDQISNISTSYGAGITNNRINIGEADTKGFEFDLGWTAIKNDNFAWDINASYATDKMTVTKVSDQSTSVSIRGGTLIGIFAEVGEVFPLIKGTDFQRDDQGRVIIGSNGTPLINNDFVALGQATPKFTVGLNSTLRYKGFTLGFVSDYRGGHKLYSGTKRQLAWSGYLVESAENGRNEFIFPNSVIEDPNNAGSYIPNTSTPTASGGPGRFLNYYSGNYTAVASNLVIDASAFKVREISFSYDLPSNFIGKTGLSDITVGVQARNPITILSAENKGYVDPESSNVGGARNAGISTVGNNPNTKTLGFSLNLKF
ncbi:MAG: SusC/RagA family TonB-linked outer membrane protein [Flavobacteriaceae bacterium]